MPATEMNRARLLEERKEKKTDEEISLEADCSARRADVELVTDFTAHAADHIWWCNGDLLDVQLLMVLTHSPGLGGQGVEHNSRVDEIFLYTLEPSVQLLEPHQLSGIWSTQGKKASLETSGCGEFTNRVKKGPLGRYVWSGNLYQHQV